MVDVFCVPPDQTDQVWPIVDGHIRAAIAYAATVDLDVLRANLRLGQYLLWLIVDGQNPMGALVTSLASANGVKLCTIITCGGTGMSDWLHLIDKIENWARSEGCSRMSIWGRSGWSRVLTEYRQKAVVLEKDLSK